MMHLAIKVMQVDLCRGTIHCMCNSSFLAKRLTSPFSADSTPQQLEKMVQKEHLQNKLLFIHQNEYEDWRNELAQQIIFCAYFLTLNSQWQ